MSQTSTPAGTVGTIENTKNKSLILHNETHIESIKPKQIILDEDTYTDALSEIIKRDFFPSLLTLEAQHDYVDAWSTNNPDLIIQATQKLNELANNTPNRKTPIQKTPISLSSTATTNNNMTSSTTTTTTTTATNNINRTTTTRGEWDTPVSTSDSNIFKIPAPKKYNTNLPLDAFQAKYTSEDNASFSELIRKSNEQRKEKYKWMYEKENDLKMIGDSNNNNNNNNDGVMIEGSSDNKAGEIASWKYKVKNTLMFYPEGENQIPEDNPRRAPKQIVHSATRFESQDETTIYNHAAATAAAATVSGTNMDSTSESDTPRVGGYGFVSATPSPSPSQFDSSELMTWGVIEGSPQLIGGDQTPGRTFQLPPTPRREIIGMNLSSTASRNIRKRNLSLKSPSLSSPSPLSRMASPRVRAALLSPAARKLLRKSNLTPRGSRTSGNVDSQLRDFYNSSSHTTMTSPSTPTSKYVTQKMESIINNNNNNNNNNSNNNSNNNNHDANNNHHNNNNPRPIKINENEK